MTVRDLVKLLEDLDPSIEVRLAQQPSWPFEYAVGRVVCVRTGGPEVGDIATYEDDGGTEHTGVVTETMADGVRVEEENGVVREVPFYQLLGYPELTEVVYIAEGSQLGYLPEVVSGELGWR